MTWKNDPLKLYHGTAASRLSSYQIIQGSVLEGFDVDITKGRSRTDFGRGFYTSSVEQQARDWANTLVMRSRRRNNSDYAVVISFEVDRNLIADHDILCFVLPSSDFWDFVQSCRTGINLHRREHSKAVYDIVFGLVTIQHSVMRDGDQVSFHTDTVARKLPRPVVHSVATASSGRF